MKQTMRLPLLSSALSLPPSQGRGRPSGMSMWRGERGLTRIFRAKRRLVSCAFMTRREIQTTHRRRQRKGKGGADGGERGRRPRSRIYTGYETGIPMLSILLCASSVSVDSDGRTAVGPFYFFFSRRNCFYAPPFHSVPPLPLYVISGKGKKTHDAENINERRRRGTALRPK